MSTRRPRMNEKIGNAGEDGAAQDVAEPRARYEIRTMDTALASAEQALDVLVGRLSPVMNDKDDDYALQAMDPDLEFASELARTLASYNYRLESLTQRVAFVVRRLEV